MSGRGISYGYSSSVPVLVDRTGVAETSGCYSLVVRETTTNFTSRTDKGVGWGKGGGVGCASGDSSQLLQALFKTILP